MIGIEGGRTLYNNLSVYFVVMVLIGSQNPHLTAMRAFEADIETADLQVCRFSYC